MTDSSSGAGALPIVFALHDAEGDYWLNTAVAMTSAAKYAKRPIEIRIIHDATLGEVARARLGEIAREMRTPLTFVPWRLPADVDPKSLGRFSAASLFRLAIPKLFADREIVVYLDSDLVVNGVDVNEIADAAPETAGLSAAVDPFIATHDSHTRQIAELGLAPDDYFNSGVLALRPRLLPDDLISRYMAFRTRHPQAIHPDQDFLNVEFKGGFGRLPERFNTIIGDRDHRALRKVAFYADKVIHYATKIKPMSGIVCPAFIPFFAHAYLTPEIYMGSHYTAMRYLFPAAPPYTLNAKRIDQIP